MPEFDKSNINKLKDYLYHSHIHDALLENIRYDGKQRTVYVTTINRIWNVKINLTFIDVKLFLSACVKDIANSETIISLSVEEEYALVKNCIQPGNEKLETSLYMLFQMLSGNELHIISERVLIETFT